MMKPKLQRIETALNQLTQPDSRPSPTAPATGGDNSIQQHKDRTPSFSIAVQPFPAHKHNGQTPSLPKLKSPSFSPHRHSANPALAMNLLKEIEDVVAKWQQELQTIIRQIQDIYLEGPIIDGWLESHPCKPQDAQTTVRYAEGDRLMDYVREPLERANDKVTCESPRTGYRLCGLDNDGQFWSRLCPPDQVASVSIAIARYQKLRQLLNRKQDLETRLTQLAETLVVLHGHLSKD